MNTGTSSDFEHEDSVSDGEAGSGDIYDYCGESAYPNSRSYYPFGANQAYSSASPSFVQPPPLPPPPHSMYYASFYPPPSSTSSDPAGYEVEVGSH